MYVIFFPVWVKLKKSSLKNSMIFITFYFCMELHEGSPFALYSNVLLKINLSVGLFCRCVYMAYVELLLMDIRSLVNLHEQQHFASGEIVPVVIFHVDQQHQ